MLGLLLGTFAAGLLLSACGLNQEGVLPPRNDIYYPAGALVHPDGRWLFVANSNSDLRYNGGTLATVDLAKVEADRTAKWDVCPKIGYIRKSSEPVARYCCWDALDTDTLNCDSRAYVDETATVRLGSFAGAMVYQPQKTVAPGRGRLMIGVRGNSSITVVDTTVQGEHLQVTCTGTDPSAAPPPFAECDEQHRITQQLPVASDTPDNGIVRLPEEPYALALDTEENLLYVGHLRGGKISLFDLGDPLLPATPARLAAMPTLIGPFGSFFPADGGGNLGVTSLTLLRLPERAATVYATSRYLPRAGGVVHTALGPAPKAGTFRNIALVGSGETFITTLAGSELRGIQFLDSAPRAFVLQRNPPALVGFDIAPDTQGRNQAIPTEVLETCSAPTFLHRHNAGNAGERLFVTCFEAGQVYVFDPAVPRLVNIIEVGRGPAGLAFAPGADSTRAYVIGFGANNIAVVDLQPGSPTEYHVIQRIGFPSPVPR